MMSSKGTSAARTFVQVSQGLTVCELHKVLWKRHLQIVSWQCCVVVVVVVPIAIVVVAFYAEN